MSRQGSLIFSCFSNTRRGLMLFEQLPSPSLPRERLEMRMMMRNMFLVRSNLPLMIWITPLAVRVRDHLAWNINVMKRN